MRHIIYKPSIGETIPDGSMAFNLPVYGDVVGVLVADDFTTNGLVIYDSFNAINNLENPETVPYFQGFPIIIDFTPPGGDL